LRRSFKFTMVRPPRTSYSPETTKSLLKALREAAQKAGASGQASGLAGEAGKAEGSGGSGTTIPEQGRGYAAQGVKLPSPGPLSGRKSCEPAHGLTSLKGEMWGNEKLRTDGALD
jgi:NADH dehydrogenase (ubiquinone) flavoprotein 2